MRTVSEIFRDAAVLDDKGRHVNGSDKMSNHNYGDAYERILGWDGTRKKAKLVMEIGNADGSSLIAWREVFPYAHVVGFDIHPSQRTVGEDHIEFNLGDASKKEDCERVADGRRFDFVCEDATHLPEHSMLTLLYMWPWIKRGGLYVIEEFYNVIGLRNNITDLWPNARVIDTVGPSGGLEPLVVLRKV